MTDSAGDAAASAETPGAPDTGVPALNTELAVAAATKQRSPLMRVAIWGFRILTLALVVWIGMQVEIDDSIVTTSDRTLRGTIEQKGHPASADRVSQAWRIRVVNADGSTQVEDVPWQNVARRDMLETASGRITGTILQPPDAYVAGVALEMRLTSGEVVRVVPLDSEAITIGRPMVTWGLASLANSLNVATIGIALACVLAILFLSGLRWWLLARATGVDMTLSDAVRLMAIGQFYTYAPGGITTGDLIKAMYLRRKTQRTTEALVSVFADRLLGLQTMLSMGLVAVLIFGWQLVETHPRFRLVMWAAIGLTGIATLLGLIVLSRRLRRLFHVRSLLRGPLVKIADEVSHVLQPYRHAKGAVMVAACVSVCSQVLQVLMAVAFGHALGIDVPAWQYFVLIPMGAVIGAIPGLPGGLGLMEGGYIAFFAFTLAPEELSRALALSLLVRLSLMVMSAIGLFEALTFGRRLERHRDRVAAAADPSADRLATVEHRT